MLATPDPTAFSVNFKEECHEWGSECVNVVFHDSSKPQHRTARLMSKKSNTNAPESSRPLSRLLAHCYLALFHLLNKELVFSRTLL